MRKIQIKCLTITENEFDLFRFGYTFLCQTHTHQFSLLAVHLNSSQGLSVSSVTVGSQDYTGKNDLVEGLVAMSFVGEEWTSVAFSTSVSQGVYVKCELNS